MIAINFTETTELFYADQFTFSIHAETKFPFQKDKIDLDTALEEGTGDAAYLDALERSLPHFLGPNHPDLSITWQA